MTEPSAMPMWVQNLAVFDLETTSIDLASARIVTACVSEIDRNGNVVGSTAEWLADPGVEIPAVATAVHGISTEQARVTGRPAKEVVSEVLSALSGFLARGVPVVAFNAPYDFTVLKNEAFRHGLAPLPDPKPVIDPLVLDRAFDTYRKGKRTLGDVTAHYGVSFEGLAHNATADAVAAGRLALKIFEKYPERLGASFDELHESQIVWSAERDKSFQEYLARQGVEREFLPGWPVKG